MRLALTKLAWLVVRDFQPTESGSFWKDSPEHESGEMRAQDIRTEVFFVPAAAHTEKDGNFTNTQRLLQRTDSHPLRDWKGNVVRRRPDGAVGGRRRQS